jgi:3-oxoacyl-[acyl-carrier protein] reductase
VALVTGARGGIGRALIERLTATGYDVFAHSRSPLDEETTAVRQLVGDLSDPDVARAIAAQSGAVDLLVNNAADQSVALLDDLSASDWTAMLGATFLSAVHLTSALRPTFAPGACVVNVSSIEAQSAFSRHGHYAAAKAALESFTRAAALEWAHDGVRVNAVSPGLVDRPGLAEDWPEGWEWWLRTCPAGRAIRPAEVADAVAFLAAATGVSGVVLPVDGGWSASSRLT